MKTIKSIILGIVILSMIGIKLPAAFGQGQLAFAETYTKTELLSRLDPADPLFNWLETDEAHATGARVGTFAEPDKEQLLAHLKTRKFRDQLPGDLQLIPGILSPDGSYALYAIKKVPNPYTGPDEGDIQEIKIQVDQETRRNDLLISFTRDGAKKWADLTRRNSGKDLAILVDNRVYAAPRVMMEIKEGKCRISGNFSETQIRHLSNVLTPR